MHFFQIGVQTGVKFFYLCTMRFMVNVNAYRIKGLKKEVLITNWKLDYSVN